MTQEELLTSICNVDRTFDYHAKELPEDHELWETLFQMLWGMKPSISSLATFGILLGFRAKGTQLIWNNEAKCYKMVPIISEEYWPSMEEYSEAKEKYLIPLKNVIPIIFKALETKTNKKYRLCLVPEDPEGGYAGQGDLVKVKKTKQDCEQCQYYQHCNEKWMED